MWETQLSNADWDCFRTLILQQTLKTHNRPQVDSCAYLDVKRLFPKVGCARNRPQSHTVQQKLRLFLFDAGLRMGGSSALDLWDLIIEVFHSSPNQANKARDLAELQGNMVQNTTLNMLSQKSNQAHQSRSD